MPEYTCKIKKSLLVPLGVDVFLLLLLLIISFFLEGSLTEQLVLSVILALLALAFFEALSREVAMEDKGIMIKKFTRRKKLSWEDITHVGIVIIRKRVYLLLTTLKGVYFISNTYESFSALVRHIVEHIGPEKIEEDVHRQVEHPVSSISDVVPSWLAAVVILAIIVMKFSQANLIF